MIKINNLIITHTLSYPSIDPYTHARTNTHTHTYSNTHALRKKLANIKQTYKLKLKCTRMDACIQTHTHTHTHTHIYIYIYIYTYIHNTYTYTHTN